MAKLKAKNPRIASGDARLPLVTLRDLVVFPSMQSVIFVGRAPSLFAIEQALRTEKRVLLCLQKDPKVDEPLPDDVFSVGTIAEIGLLEVGPDGSRKTLVTALERAKIGDITSERDYRSASYAVISNSIAEPRSVALAHLLKKKFDEFAKLNKKIPADTLLALSNIDNPGKIADFVATHVVWDVQNRQVLLETTDITKRLELVASHVETELEVLQLEERVRSRVKGQMEKSQREYYLNEQLKAIRSELGESDDEVKKLQERVQSAHLPSKALAQALKNVDELRNMSATSSEAHVLRTQVDWLLSIPWQNNLTPDVELTSVRTQVEQHHFGADHVADWLVEQVSLQRLGSSTAQPLCFVGPPGVGKTNLAAAIAKALHREFVVVPLGGVNDVAYLRGFNRTYIGAQPGIFIRAIRQAKSLHPVVLLDEIDKIEEGHRGHPAAVLCEIVDPFSNNSFVDHYLDVPIDLAGIVFIATANNQDRIYPPLRSRLEIVEMWGYEREEKIHIGKHYLLPKLTELHKINGQLVVEERALSLIVDRYTSEPGIRQLEHLLRRICRRAAVSIASGIVRSVEIGREDLPNVLGASVLAPSRVSVDAQVGRVHVAHAVGGVSRVDCLKVEGSGKLSLIGHVGETVQEEATKAFGLIRQRFGKPGQDSVSIAIAIERAGGSTAESGFGLGIALSIASAIRNVKLPSGLVAIGDVDLHGNIDGVHGIFPRIAAARRFNATKLMLPAVHKDVGDHEQFPRRLTEETEIVFVRTIDDALKLVGL